MRDKRTFTSGLIMAIILSFLFCECTRKKEVGITEDEVRIGTWGPLTGPAALWGAFPRSIDCYFKMMNDEGGIHGRKIKLYIRDDAYQPAKTKAAVKELVGAFSG